MSVAEWLDAHVPGGSSGDFGQLCISAVLDEYGGAAEDESSLNLIDLLGADASTRSGLQPRSAPFAGGDEKWHIHGGNDLLISGILDRLPAGNGPSRTSPRRAALAGGRAVVCSFAIDGRTKEVVADQVVLAIPFTTLRQVDTRGVSIHQLHRRAINEQPMGSNAKFFAQYSSRVWDQERQTATRTPTRSSRGLGTPTDYQRGACGRSRRPARRHRRPGLGRQLRAAHVPRPATGAMVHDYLASFEQVVPGSRALYNGKSFFVWSSGDPHALGAYCYLAVGQYTAFNGIQGRQEGRLHFAGEQTSINFQGYIEGGLRSGYRCADEIATGARRR